MKKTLLTFAFCLTALLAVAQTKTYHDNLIIRVDEEVTDPLPAEVSVEYNSDGTINFILKDFVLVLGGNRMPVGNIYVPQLKLTETESYKSFVYDDDILITEGDNSVLEESEIWVGPFLGPIPLDVKGKMTDDKLYVSIDITLNTGITVQIIHVDFGEDDFSTGLNKLTTDAKQPMAVYNLAGQLVNKGNGQNLPKGIYIVNGKKVLR